MDPITVSLLSSTITGLLTSTAGEAGKSAWASLAGATRRLLGQDAPASQALAAVEGAVGTPNLPDAANTAAAQLLAAAGVIPAYADALNSWQVQAQTLLQSSISVNTNTNSVSGNAQVGKLIQAHDVGTINL